MKFLCDRCKTRYSIGDERVRGKILKIRCKHCSNVITVREGMGVEDQSVVSPLPGAPRTKTSTIAPEALDERNASSGLLNVASLSPAPSTAVARRTAVAAEAALGTMQSPSPASAPAAKPAPAALDEEWYVSIDGEQAGPLSRTEAQRWVAARPFEADLHCWSEGFDDWLSVDKVSHFRGLRKKPVPPPAPPAPVSIMPRTITPRGSAAAGPATASLRATAKSAPVERAPFVPSSPPQAEPAAAAEPSPEPPAPARAAFGAGVSPRTNGATPLPARVAPVVSAPLFDELPAGSPADTGPSSAPVFDTSAVASGPAASAFDAFDSAGHASAAPASSSASFTGDDDLDIGEVSRVVNLADLARNPRPTRRAAGTATGSNPRVTGAQAALRATGAQAALRATGAHASLSGPIAAATLEPSGPIGVPGVPGAIGAATSSGPLGAAPGIVAAFGAVLGNAGNVPGAPTPDATPPVAVSHRRGLIALLGVAGVLVIGVIIAVFALVSPASDTSGGSLGKVNDIDTSRPDDPITHRPGPTPPTPGSAAPPTTGQTPHNPIHRPTPTPPIGGHEPDPTPPATDSLRSDEIEDTARKHQDTTQRCYMRSQRGADAILVGDVKKIAVTLQIEKDGSVTDVQLSDHAADTLGKCLSTSIRGWKFRTSAGGRFRFSLNFVSG